MNCKHFTCHQCPDIGAELERERARVKELVELLRDARGALFRWDRDFPGMAGVVDRAVCARITAALSDAPAPSEPPKCGCTRMTLCERHQFGLKEPAPSAEPTRPFTKQEVHEMALKQGGWLPPDEVERRVAEERSELHSQWQDAIHAPAGTFPESASRLIDERIAQARSDALEEAACAADERGTEFAISAERTTAEANAIWLVAADIRQLKERKP